MFPLVQLRVFVQIVVTLCTVSLVFGVPSAYLSPEMSDALHLLSPEDQFRFGAACLGSRKCSRIEVTAFTPLSLRREPAARERLWFTYACMWSEDPGDCPEDGGWSAWSEWGDCDATCGDGTKLRHRLCDRPVPRNGGNDCHGQANSVTSCRVQMACPTTDEELSDDSVQQRALSLMQPYNHQNDELHQTCMKERCSYQQVTEMVTPKALADVYWTNLMCYKHFEGCAVDGGWSEWNAWSSCSSQCGTGKAYRSRRCTNPQPRHNGRHCQGPEYEEGGCFDDSCVEAVGVLLTPWSMWSACSSTCYEGVKTSSRRCHGSDVCDVGNGQVAAELTRAMPCSEGLCPEMGGWSEWSDWTVCSAVCGEGRRMKERVCNNPRPRGPGEGNDCVGSATEEGSCSHHAPFCDGIPQNVQMYEAWSHWSDCSAHCDGGMRIRHRTCPEQKHDCRGELYDLHMCNTDVPCKVDGAWSEWTAWSVCTVTCGEGQAERHRQCTHPRPEYGGRSCPGEANEKRKCLVSECPETAPTWQSWGQWSRCTVTCAGGTSTRTRGCSVRDATLGRWTTVPISRCTGEFKQINVCNFLPCPVNGNWASWGEWGGCSRTCGEGVVTRDRTCTDPAPAGTGKLCSGFGTETVLCYKQPCPLSEQIVRKFNGASFMMYRRAAVPSRQLLVYVRFKPSTLSGLLALRRKDADSHQVVSIGLAAGNVRLNAQIGDTESEVISIDEVHLNQWNDVEVSISGGNTGLRVNDGVPVTSNFTLPLPTHLNWDQTMFVGGALPHLFPGPAREYVGFVGAISALRVNYREYTLHDIRPEWTGVGLPFVSFHVDTLPADTDAQVTVFTGDDFAFVPSPAPATDGELSLKVVFRPDAPDGIILYGKGRAPGSFVALTMSDSRVALFVNLGKKTSSSESIEIALSKWTIVHLTVAGADAEMRVNGGPAVQLAAPGTNFEPMARFHVGGVPFPDKTVASLTTGTDRGLVGAVYEVTVNRKQYLMSETALSTGGGMYLDSASTTLSAHYREVGRVRHSNVMLHCNYSNIHSEEPVVTWLHDGKILENSDHVTIFKPRIVLPHFSVLSVHDLNAESEGMYACMVWYHGKAIITHAYGISVYELHFVSFRWESGMELMVAGNVALIFGIIIGIFALSCCKICRKRYFFLDMMYQSALFYFGLDSCACLRDPNVPDHDTLRQINATYDEDFSAREEKIKFDLALKKKEKKEKKPMALGERAKRFKDKIKEKLNREKESSDKGLGNPTDVQALSARSADENQSKTTKEQGKSVITVKPNDASGKNGKSGAESPRPQHPDRDSPEVQRNERYSGENIQRRPSDSLSDREINLRRLSHEIVTGKPESSTSGSSLGSGLLPGDRSPEMEGSWTPVAANRESVSSLVVMEGDEEHMVLEAEGGQVEDGWESVDIDEPVYVNVKTIHERRRQSQTSKNNVKFEKRTPSDSGDTSDSPPVVPSPKLLDGEPVEVDMEAVRDNWKKSKLSKEVLMSSDSEIAPKRSSHGRLAPQQDDQRRSSVAQAGQDAGRLFSHRGSIGGAVAKLSEAVADEVDGARENDVLERIDEVGVDEAVEGGKSIAFGDDDGDGFVDNDQSAQIDSAPSASCSSSDSDEDGSGAASNKSDTSRVSDENDD